MKTIALKRGGSILGHIGYGRLAQNRFATVLCCAEAVVSIARQPKAVVSLPSREGSVEPLNGEARRGYISLMSMSRVHPPFVA